MQFVKKVSPGQTQYGITLPIWAALGMAGALLLALILSFVLLFVWLVGSRRREKSN